MVFLKNVLNYKTFLENLKKEIELYINNKQLILKLKNEKKYDEIYNLFGQKTFLSSVPKKYSNEEILGLIEERKFETVFIKYGYKKYKEYLPEMNMKENFDEYGDEFIDKKIKFHYLTLRRIKVTLALLAGLSVSLPLLFNPVVYASESFINSIIYSEEIDEYNRENIKYAEYINSLNLNDLETIMKVIDDTWNKLERFGEPESEVYGYFRLQFLDDKPIGVCRHIADDVGAKLNTINPNYNARNINVVLNDENGLSIAGVSVKEKTRLFREERSNSSNLQALFNTPTDAISKVFGNHMVLLVDINEDDITLVVDPTNPSIGVFKNGHIYMFSKETGDACLNPLWEQFVYGPEREIDYCKAKFLSYNYSDLEELEKEWGIEAEDVALQHARAIAQLALPDGYSYTKK